MPNTRRGLPTRLLHMALLVSVLWQLVGSNWVEPPRSAQPGNWFYQVHEVVGLVTFGLVLAFWLWAAFRRRETPIGSLFPWLSVTRMKSVAADAVAHWTMLRQWRLHHSEADSPLVSAVHGLGLLTVLSMGASGAWLYTMNKPDGLVLDFHELMSNLMWAYVIGHAGIGVIHQLNGHMVLQRMFGRRSVE